MAKQTNRSNFDYLNKFFYWCILKIGTYLVLNVWYDLLGFFASSMLFVVQNMKCFYEY
jgi:hypothetical protein